MQNKVTQVRM